MRELKGYVRAVVGAESVWLGARLVGVPAVLSLFKAAKGPENAVSGLVSTLYKVCL